MYVLAASLVHPSCHYNRPLNQQINTRLPLLVMRRWCGTWGSLAARLPLPVPLLAQMVRTSRASSALPLLLPTGARCTEVAVGIQMLLPRHQHGGPTCPVAK